VAAVTRSGILAGLMLLATATAVATAQQAVFRASTSSITVDVSVRQNGRPLTDLGPDDFEVRDAGLVQQITEVTRETLPIDVTCIVDLSGSVQGPVLEALTRSINAIGQRLRPTDRASVITFNQQIRQVRPLQPGGWPDGLALGSPSSLTSLFDAVTVALIAAPEIGRRRMAIIFTDGLDISSFLDGTDMIDVARRSGTAVFTVALAEGTVRRPRRPAHESLFTTLSNATGGVLDVLQRDEDLSGSFAQAFEEFRTSYVLSYGYDGPPMAGWHPIEVRVTRPGTFDVRARQGYFSAEER
jgi:Ca-activated chloride channel family protein